MEEGVVILIGVVIGFGILLLLIVPFIPVTTTYNSSNLQPIIKTKTILKNVSKILINDKPTVDAGKVIYYRVYIDINGKSNNIISGKVIETSGHDINFYVFDQKGFNTYNEGGEAPAYVYAKRVSVYTFSFVPDHSGYYYFVLDNGYSIFTNKVPYIIVYWNYSIPVQVNYTTYKNMVYRSYKTKYCSVLQLLTSNC